VAKLRSRSWINPVCRQNRVFLTPYTQLPLDEVCEAGILSGYDELSAFAGSAEVN